MKSVGVGQILMAVLILAGVIWFMSPSSGTPTPTAQATVQTSNAASMSAPPQCESGWTQATSSMYFLNPEGCGSTRLELASGGSELTMGLINPAAKDCEKYNVDGTAYDSLKLIDVDVNGDAIQLTRSCVNGDEMFTPNRATDHATFFGHLNSDKVITMRFPQGKVLRYQNPNYLQAADNLIRFSGTIQ